MNATFAYLGVPLAAFLLLAFNVPRAEASTIVIAPGDTTFPATVQQGDTLVIEQGAAADLSLTNHGMVINRGTVSGTIANQESGKIVNEQGATMGALIDNRGTFENRGDYASPQAGGTFENRATGRVDNYGYFDAHTLNVENRGHFAVMSGGTFVIFNGVTFTNDGGELSNSGTFRLSKATEFKNINGGAVVNNAGGEFFSGGYGTGSGVEFVNNAMVSNAGIFTNHDTFYNNGAFNNSGTLYNRQIGFTSPLFANAGTLDNSGNLLNLDDSDMSTPVTIRNSGTLNNWASMSNTGADAVVENGCDATFNNAGTFAGTPAVDTCPSHSTIHMPAPTASAGYGVYEAKPARAEYVTAESQLAGDSVDSITLRLKKVGDISGYAQVGVFNEDLSAKKLFGTLDVSTLTESYADYEFKVDGLYTIQPGDRIGIKYADGTYSSWVSVMLDLDPAGQAFDGSASFHQHYQSGAWHSNEGRDLYMILKQTQG